MSAVVAVQSEMSITSLREATRRWLVRERARGAMPTGVAALDVMLGGGWPTGRVAELVGVGSAGRTAAAAATVAAAVERGGVAAWIDLADALDPVSLRAAGVVLERVLWVRPRGLDEAVRASELVLDNGGFPLVVLDLAEARLPLNVIDTQGRRRGRRDALRLRLSRAAERAGAVLLVLTRRPWVGTLAGVTLALGPGRAQWGGEETSPRWLATLEAGARLERGGPEHGRRRTALRFGRDDWRGAAAVASGIAPVVPIARPAGG